MNNEDVKNSVFGALVRSTMLASIVANDKDLGPCYMWATGV